MNVRDTARDGVYDRETSEETKHQHLCLASLVFSTVIKYITVLKRPTVVSY